MADESKKIKVTASTLMGTVTISGAKNSALKLLAASILTDHDIVLTNYPSELLDCEIHEQMLVISGKKIEKTTNQIRISKSSEICSELMWNKRSIRNTLLILGALLVRTGRGKVPLPGGCKIGERKYDLHIVLMEKFGAKVWEEGNYLLAETKKDIRGTEIFLPIRSTGATENAVLIGAIAKGQTRIWNPHIRPEIIDLINFLNEIGADITIRGQESIVIKGVAKLGGTIHRVIPDNIEAITWLIGTIITKGEVEIIDFPFEHLEVPLIQLRESGAKFYRGQNSIIVKGGKCYPFEISTGPYPGVNSDMQSLFAVYGLCARGESKIVDLRFPDRYGYVAELEKMGGKFKKSGNILSIIGRSNLIGATVKAIDLRTGAALLSAGLIAKGETIIEDAWQIERGYNLIWGKLKSLTNNSVIFIS